LKKNIIVFFCNGNKTSSQNSFILLNLYSYVGYLQNVNIKSWPTIQIVKRAFHPFPNKDQIWWDSHFTILHFLLNLCLQVSLCQHGESVSKLRLFILQKKLRSKLFRIRCHSIFNDCLNHNFKTKDNIINEWLLKIVLFEAPILFIS